MYILSTWCISLPTTFVQLLTLFSCCYCSSSFLPSNHGCRHYFRAIFCCHFPFLLGSSVGMLSAFSASVGWHLGISFIAHVDSWNGISSIGCILFRTAARAFFRVVLACNSFRWAINSQYLPTVRSEIVVRLFDGSIGLFCIDWVGCRVSNRSC